MLDDEEVIRLRRRFDKHLDDYRSHIMDYEHREMQNLLNQERTSVNIANLTKALELQIEATKGPVSVWNFMEFLQKSVLWVSGFSGVVAAIAWYNDWLPK
jgi:hypothetical protein